MRSLLSLCTLSLAAASAVAQPGYEHGLEWRTVGAPGNTPAMPGDRFWRLAEPRGAVDYEFRMARTEVTNTQWLEFVIAITTVIPSTTVDGSLTGGDISRVSRPWGYEWQIFGGTDQRGATMGWDYAARYCNWLHNGKAMTPGAFLSGAYDVSTFWPSPGPAQNERSPGARFWIPSKDEWIKAMFYDPHKLGPGQGDYWMYPISSDVPPVGGPPGTPGAQTGAGNYSGGSRDQYPVGSYPNAQSPWGILDGSGGVREWCEGYAGEGFRTVLGTANEDPDLWLADRLDEWELGHFRSPHAGLRVVGTVPTPSSGALVLVCVQCCLFRRRR